MNFTIIFFLNDTATTEIYTLPLPDALPISLRGRPAVSPFHRPAGCPRCVGRDDAVRLERRPHHTTRGDRKSTRLNSSHGYISYAVFCLKKKNTPFMCVGSGDEILGAGYV